jgi:hypothetical protein
VAGLQFRIQYPDGRLEQLVVDSDSVLIGSGSHCEIRLPPEQAAVEHVLITFLGGAVYAQARYMNPPPTINGAPFTQAPLLPESVLAVGHVQMAVAVVEIADDPNVIKKKEQKTSPVTLVLCALLFPAAIILMMQEDDKYGIGEVPEAPALWPDPPAACQQQARDLAFNLGVDKKVHAESKRERCPFHVQDCVQAIPSFELSSVCFKTAGEDDLAKDMTRSAVAMRERVNQTYRGHQMRLEHTITIGDLLTAQKQVKILLEMLDGQQGPYITWLSNHDRKLAMRVAALKAK